jgi:hypothetical protein
VADEESLAPADLLNKLSNALMLVSRGDPLVALRSEIDTRFRSLSVEFKAVETRFDSIDKSIALQHEDQVRVPTLLQSAVISLRELVEQTILTKIAEVLGEFKKHSSQTDQKLVRVDEKLLGLEGVVMERITSLTLNVNQRFSGIVDTFAEKDKAVSVGLSAQKEAAAAQQASNTAATQKMEDNFTKLLQQGSDLLNEVRRNTELQISDIKSRLDKGEGRTGVTDPALAEALRELVVMRISQGQQAGQKEGGASIGLMVIGTGTILSGLMSMVTVIILLISHH